MPSLATPKVQQAQEGCVLSQQHLAGRRLSQAKGKGMTWIIRAAACLVSVLFIIYLRKNAASISQLLGRRISRPEAQEFWKEDYAWIVLVIGLIVVAVLLLPFVLDLITKSFSGQ